MNKRIVVIGHADGMGGAQTAFRELQKFLIEEGHKVKIITIGKVNSLKNVTPNIKILANIPSISTSFKLKVSKIVNLVIAGIRSRKFNPDFFISVGLSNSANFIIRFLNKQCFTIGQDFIANRTVNDTMWQSSRSFFNGVAVQSPSMLTYWKAVETCTRGLSWLPCFPELPVENILHTPSTGISFIKVAYFGRLAANKGLPLFFKALADNHQFFSITLDLWGKGAELKSLQKLAEKLNIDDKVNFCGSYPGGKEGAELMASYDALILTSTETEGLPLVLLEAMAYGVPFLATDVGAIVDCCYQNEDVILVQPNQKAIQQGLVELCERLQTGNFNSGRLQRYYQNYFSHPVIASRWRLCLQNPQQFFYE